MKKYTIHCTTEQTRKALELGAPINTRWDYDGNQLPFEAEISIEYRYYAEVPTAEQMTNWLEEQIDNIDLIKDTNGKWLYLFYPTNSSKHEIKSGYPTRKEATLAAIDEALEYLSKNKK